MKKTIGFLGLSAVLGLMSPAAQAYTAAETAALKSEISADKSKVLAIVSSKVSASPEDAGAIVKAAIEATNASPALVAEIVKAAALAAPDKVSEIAEAALAVAPNAVNEVQAVLAALNAENPLNFPGTGIGPVGMYPQFAVRGPLYLVTPPGDRRFTTDVNP